ncbi:MAG: tetratricopeptide repeat protein [Geminicoccaceae bacterium]
MRLAGRHEAAIATFRQALAMEPDRADLHADLAGALLAAERWEPAELAARRALEGDPGHPVALANLGAALLGQGRWDEARDALGSARDAGRDSFGLWLNLGHLELASGTPEAAEAAYRQALARDPGSVEACRGLGFALARLRRVGEAEPMLERFVAARSEPSNAHFMLGHVRFLAGRQAEGLEPLRCGALRPGAPAGEASTYLFDLNYVAGLPVASLLEAHRDWARRYADGLDSGSSRFANQPDPLRCLRVGIVSPDLRAHSVAFFLLPLLRALDRRKVEVVAYADVASPDPMTERLRAETAAWRDIRGTSDVRVARMIRDDGIDILLDLAGHTADNRLLLFARRAAPVQASYLGYPATTGMAAIDARIVDSWTDGPDSDAAATERLVRLDRCFLAYEPALYPAIAPPPSADRGHVTFGSFNNLAKLNPAVVALWSAVLRAVPGSQLVLKHDVSHDPAVQGPLLRAFAGEGIAAGRIRFLDRSPDLLSHLAAYREVDIALDPTPYNGTTTTCEALWMGVPVMTLRGDRHAARVGTSLLTAVGFDAGIAADSAEYVLTASELARAPRLLEALRGMLRPQMLASPLCDAAGLAAAFEASLRDLWREWCATGRIARPAAERTMPGPTHDGVASRIDIHHQGERTCR